MSEEWEKKLRKQAEKLSDEALYVGIELLQEILAEREEKRNNG
jgi:hypothetical protein